MAKYTLTKLHEQDDHDQYEIVVTFGEHEFTQEVILPKHGAEKAAQEYADEYEKNYTEAHSEEGEE